MLLGMIAGLFDSLQDLIAGQLIFIEADGHLVRQQIDVALFNAVQLAHAPLDRSAAGGAAHACNIISFLHFITSNTPPLGGV